MPNGASLRVQRMWIAGTVFSITGYHRAVTRRFRYIALNDSQYFIFPVIIFTPAMQIQHNSIILI